MQVEDEHEEIGSLAASGLLHVHQTLCRVCNPHYSQDLHPRPCHKDSDVQDYQLRGVMNCIVCGLSYIVFKLRLLCFSPYQCCQSF